MRFSKEMTEKWRKGGMTFYVQSHRKRTNGIQKNNNRLENLYKFDSRQHSKAYSGNRKFATVTLHEAIMNQLILNRYI